MDLSSRQKQFGNIKNDKCRKNFKKEEEEVVDRKLRNFKDRELTILLNYNQLE